MRYMLLICDDKAAPAPPEKEMDAIVQGHMRVAQELHAAGKMVMGERLRPDSEASRVRVKAGQRQVMDGPVRRDQGSARRLLPDRVRHQGGGRGVGEEDPAARGRLHRGGADLAM